MISPRRISSSSSLASLSLIGAAMLFAAAGCTNTTVPASTAETAPPTADSIVQRTFASPDEAVAALKAAAESQDRPTLRAIFGPESLELISGDEVADANARAGFARAIAQFCRLAYVGDDKVVLNLGAQDWPFPIPLVKKSRRWSFDTAAGKDEIINRRIGENELMAIDVCRIYVDAQHEYATQTRDGSTLKFAQKMKSTPGQKDGLYWDVGPNEDPSPFGPLVASARAEGYTPRQPGEPPRPFHGYLFKVLTAQGPNAPGGKKSYLVNGELTAGFALVAQPVKWGDSGVMTFIVNQDGKVYQRNLGEDTAQEVSEMTEFDPAPGWTALPFPGAQ